MDLDWRTLSAHDREREYSPSSCIGGNYQPYISAYVERSAAARRSHPPTTIRYGATERQTLDLFIPEGVAAAAGAGVLPWRLLAGTLEAGVGLRRAGVPRSRHRLRRRRLHAGARRHALEIVEECRAAVASLSRFDRLVVAGSSAGAHLAAMAALALLLARLAEPVKGAVLVSGIYDLEPLIGTSINAALGLDSATAARNSPLRQALEGLPAQPCLLGRERDRSVQTPKPRLRPSAAPEAGTDARLRVPPPATTSTSSWILPTPPRIGRRVLALNSVHGTLIGNLRDRRQPVSSRNELSRLRV